MAEEKMLFLVTYDEKNSFIESCLKEDFDWSVMEKMVPQISRWINEKNCHRVLLDFRDSDMNLSTLKIYLTPDRLADEFKKYGVSLLSLKRAMIIAKNDSDYHFLETVSVNRSQRLKLFFDRESALEWLLNKE